MQYIQLNNINDVIRLDLSGPFKAVLIADQAMDHAQQCAISEWLIRAGCAYAMVTGRHIAGWNDMLDLVNLALFDFAYIPDDGIVMTTIHANETLEDVLWFSRHSAMHPCFELETTLCVDLNAHDREREIQALWESV